MGSNTNNSGLNQFQNASDTFPGREGMKEFLERKYGRQYLKSQLRKDIRNIFGLRRDVARSNLNKRIADLRASNKNLYKGIANTRVRKIEALNAMKKAIRTWADQSVHLESYPKEYKKFRQYFISELNRAAYYVNKGEEIPTVNTRNYRTYGARLGNYRRILAEGASDLLKRRGANLRMAQRFAREAEFARAKAAIGARRLYSEPVTQIRSRIPIRSYQNLKLKRGQTQQEIKNLLNQKARANEAKARMAQELANAQTRASRLANQLGEQAGANVPSGPGGAP